MLYFVIMYGVIKLLMQAKQNCLVSKVFSCLSSRILWKGVPSYVLILYGFCPVSIMFCIMAASIVDVWLGLCVAR